MENIDLNLTVNENPSYNIITTSFDLYLKELEILFKTGDEEVYGVYNALNIKKYLFNKYITIKEIENEISEAISKHCENSQFFTTIVEAKLVYINNKENMVITINITDENNETIKPTYIITT